jgi:cobalt-precorrin 5A hydrolase/precorrin-3B C17-methyltransferase
MSQPLFVPFQPLAAIATTPQAAQLLQPLCQSTGATLWVPDSFPAPEAARVYVGSLKTLVAQLWQECRGLIFCLAAGAVVRLIAPLLQDKARDPAVVVIDGAGHFAISLSGGHQGGADLLAQLIAQQLAATPVLTGAAASLGLPAIDVLGIPFGWRQGSGDWTGVSAAIARRQVVEVIQEAGSPLWQSHLPAGHPFKFGSPETSYPTPSAKIWISATQRQFFPEAGLPQVQWHPRTLWVGIGCIRGTPAQLIASAIEQVCRRRHLAGAAIAGIATIALKADEAGLLAFCQERQLPLKTFSAEVLRQIAVPNPSAAVAQAVGTPSVAEAAAVAAAVEIGREIGETGGNLGFYPPLLVPKQVIKSPAGEAAVTVAIAQSPREYTGRTGQIWLVGTGPGSLEQIAPAAKTAIAQADAIIGYSLYLELIQPLQRPGQIVEAFSITQERQRAQRAIELAQWGLAVAVVSSGDCGIYGMGGLVLEELRERGWDGKVPQVQVFPGITAAVAAAARVGTPLMHDFCTISLSDLLTPWEVIAKRLEMAAAGDFVTALYNPRSQQRTEAILQAQEIFRQYRQPHTPIALVRSAYRPDEQITLTTLENMLQFPIDMLTTVIIGSSNTYRHGDWLIAPRGYMRRGECGKGGKSGKMEEELQN